MKTSSILLVAAFAVTACSQTAKTDIAKEEAAIRAKETGWMAAYNKRDANALAAEYADDGAVANPGAALANDTVSRRRLLDRIAGDEALKLDFASDRVLVAASGDLASSRGHYTMTYTDPGTKKSKTESGHYLTVYRKAADGSWQAVEDFITPGPATKAEAAD